MPNKAKSVTIFDVAHRAGVSKSTVSLVLTHSNKVADKSKQKVLQAIDELAYVYNRDAAAMRSGRSNLVVIVIDDLTNPLMALLAKNIEQALSEAFFQAIIVSSNNSVERQTQLINNLKEYKVAAFIICPVASTCAQWLDNLAAAYHVISLMHEVPYSSAPCVLPDYTKASHVVTLQLINDSPKNILFMGDESLSAQGLLSGFNSACKKHNITPEPAITCTKSTPLHAKQIFSSTLLNNPSIDAVVCANNIIAHGVLAAAPHLKSNIVSCLHIPDITEMQPRFTCANINTQELAKRSILVLQEQLQTNTAPVKTLVNVNLQIRETP